jgi:hypothetical protein
MGDALFDGSTRFPTRFTLPDTLVWAGNGEDPRPRLQKMIAVAKRRQRPQVLSDENLLSDAELAEIAVGVENDPALSEGCSVELLEHPIYGAELGFSFCLEFCQHRFDLTNDELKLNLWYRCERFVRLKERNRIAKRVQNTTSNHS